jgi:hypothetical protein
VISNSVCMVFGAGVSCSYNFLTGRDLWYEVCTSLDDRQSAMSQTLVEAGFQPGEVENFGRHLAASQLGSIDRFIENNSDWSEIGRAAIAAALIPREIPSHVIQPNKEERIYEYIWHRMGPALDDFTKNRLSIVTFNYDRSFEFFFLNALTYGFGMPLPKAEEIFRSTVPLVHVYGQLNSLQYAQNDGMPYGAAVDAMYINTAAGNIELVGKNRGLSNQVKAAQALIAAADLVIFLGFGYDQLNLERLALPLRKAGQRYLGTAYGLKSGERAIIIKYFSPIGQITLGEPDTNAHIFLRQHADLLV